MKDWKGWSGRPAPTPIRRSRAEVMAAGRYPSRIVVFLSLLILILPIFQDGQLAWFWLPGQFTPPRLTRRSSASKARAMVASVGIWLAWFRISSRKAVWRTKHLVACQKHPSETSGSGTLRGLYSPVAALI